MGNKKIYFLSLAIFTYAMGFLINHLDDSQALIKELRWVLQELPEVKSIEYLETLKKS